MDKQFRVRFGGHAPQSAAIKVTEKYLLAVSRLPLDSANGGGVDVEDLRVSSSKMVFDMISGNRGKTAVRDMFSMLAYFMAPFKKTTSQLQSPRLHPIA